MRIRGFQWCTRWLVSMRLPWRFHDEGSIRLCFVGGREWPCSTKNSTNCHVFKACFLAFFKAERCIYNTLTNQIFNVEYTRSLWAPRSGTKEYSSNCHTLVSPILCQFSATKTYLTRSAACSHLLIILIRRILKCDSTQDGYTSSLLLLAMAVHKLLNTLKWVCVCLFNTKCVYSSQSSLHNVGTDNC